MTKRRKGFPENRENVSGRYVTERDAKNRPRETTKEIVPTKGNGDTDRYNKSKKK